MRSRDFILADPSYAIGGIDIAWRRAARHEMLAKDQSEANRWKASILRYNGRSIENRHSLSGMVGMRVGGRFWLAIAIPSPIAPYGMDGRCVVEDALMIHQSLPSRMFSGRKLDTAFDARQWALHFAGERYQYLRSKAMGYDPAREWDGMSIKPIRYAQ